MDPLLMNYRLAVFSHEPPKYPNVLWICPMDEKHFDVRMYTTILEDEYTSIKKWTSIGISNLEQTNLSTDSWYVGTVDEFPVLDIEFSPIEVNDVIFESYQLEDIVYTPVFLLNNLINKLDEKKVYFDTRPIDYEKTPHKYYVVVVPLEYKINTIRKDNYYENTKSYHEDALIEGNYIVKKGLESNGKFYNILFLLFKFEELPFLITTNVVKDLVVSDYIVLECGNSVDRVMSQQAVTKELDVLKDILSNVDVPNLATVAKTGDYNDLLNKPVIPEIPEIPDLSGFQTVELALEQYNELYNNDTAIAQEVLNLMIRTDAVELNIDKNTLNIELKQDAEVVLAYLDIKDMNLVDNNIVLENNNKVIIIRSISSDFTITIKGNSSIIFTIGENVPQITFTPVSWVKTPLFEPNNSYMLAFDYIDKLMDDGVHAVQITGMWVKIEEY